MNQNEKQDNKDIGELLNDYYESLTLPQLEKEVRNAESLRQPYQFCKGFAELKNKINAQTAKLKESGCTQEVIAESLSKTFNDYTFFKKNSPATAILLAKRKLELLQMFVQKAEEEYSGYKEQLINEYGLDI